MDAIGRAFVEIRIHGVGDHDYLTALGEPRIRTVNHWMDTASPPAAPGHRLEIVNWSRATRKRIGVLWYLAFPFTLANVAGFMGAASDPERPRDNAVLRLCVGWSALILSCAQLAWFVVLAETVLQYVPGLGYTGRLVPLIAAGLMAFWLGVRWRRVIRRQADQPTGRNWAPPLVHASVVLAVGVLLAVLQPARLAYSGWPAVAPPGAAGNTLDAMALWLVLSTGAVLAAAGVLVLRSWSTPKLGRSAHAPAVAAGGLLVAAMLMLHTVNSLLRMVLDNVMGYISGLFGQAVPPWNNSTAVLLGYDNPAEAGDSRLDLFTFLAAIMVLATVLAAGVVLRFAGTELSPLWGGKAARGRWWHARAEEAPELFVQVLPLGGILGALGVYLAVSAGEGRLGGPWLALAVLVLHLAGGALILVVLLGQLAAVRNVLAKIADVAGFWPVQHHPLSGISYRDAVVAGIAHEVDRCGIGKTALVAHSQGSVICAWLLAGKAPEQLRDKPHFVTAGSPLVSLFARFFPRHFPPRFFAKVSNGTASWQNFWRGTDPIGTAVPRACNTEIADPDQAGSVQGHAGYWTAPEVTEHIRRIAAGR